MNLKRAVGIILLLCIASLAFTAVLSRVFQLDLEITDPANIPLAMWLSAIISVGVLIGVGAIWFFNSPDIVPGAKNGFLFGSIAVMMGLIGDFLAFVPHKDGLNIFHKYFTQPMFWMAFVVILIVSTLVGHLKAKDMNS